MITLPTQDEMIKISAEQRINFAAHSANGGYYRISSTGEVTELSKEEWDELFNGEEWE